MTAGWFQTPDPIPKYFHLHPPLAQGSDPLPCTFPPSPPPPPPFSPAPQPPGSTASRLAVLVKVPADKATSVTCAGLTNALWQVCVKIL